MTEAFDTADLGEGVDGICLEPGLEEEAEEAILL